jgi:hypothetical protein
MVCCRPAQRRLQTLLRTLGTVVMKKLLSLFIDRMDQKQEFFKMFMDDHKIRNVISDFMLKQEYARLRSL